MDSLLLRVGQRSESPYVEVYPWDAECTGMRWYSDDPSIASVDESSGCIHANALGTTRIHVTATDGSGCAI